MTPTLTRRRHRPPTTLTFDTVSSFTWTVPAGVRQATFNLFGAEGEAGAATGGAGGLGGRAVETIPVVPGTTYQINVGGRGSDGANQTIGSLLHGNGGGRGGGGACSVAAALGIAPSTRVVEAAAAGVTSARPARRSRPASGAETAW